MCLYGIVIGLLKSFLYIVYVNMKFLFIFVFVVILFCFIVFIRVEIKCFKDDWVKFLSLKVFVYVLKVFLKWLYEVKLLVSFMYSFKDGLFFFIVCL